MTWDDGSVSRFRRGAGKGTCQVQLLHGLAKTRASFDDSNLVSHVGLFKGGYGSINYDRSTSPSLSSSCISTFDRVQYGRSAGHITRTDRSGGRGRLPRHSC